MKEFLTIVEEFEKTTRDGKAAALATVVQVSGSTYRLPGARMLMTQEGHSVGSISGGCLEADVFERAQQVMVSGEPVVVTYDTTSDTDIVWGLGLGCNGLVRVLPIASHAPESASSLSLPCRVLPESADRCACHRIPHRGPSAGERRSPFNVATRRQHEQSH